MATTKTKAILIDLIAPRMTKEQSLDRLEELEDLVETYGGIVVVKTHQRRLTAHPKTFIGPGKAQEIAKEGKELGATLLIINDRLKPRQVYELQEILRLAKIEVWDRIDLILKIFAKHARTTEARLEIELASIRHMGPRIFGMGMELSRQAGGIGTVGIGEQNTEIMKRHLRAQEQKIKEKLIQYQNVRTSHRLHRKRQQLKTVSLVGYTNAGKTSLLNRLTGRKEYVANQLFATLDTRVGEVFLQKQQKKFLLSDTIGFIRNLPPELIHAFESTLSEAMDSDLLLQVIDSQDPKCFSKIQVVEEILAQLDLSQKPKIYVFNKIDAWKKRELMAFKKKCEKELESNFLLFVSAISGEGLEKLKEMIGTFLFPKQESSKV